MYTSVPQGGLKTFTNNRTVYCECVNHSEQDLGIEVTLWTWTS